VRNGLFARRPNDAGAGTPILRISAVRDGKVDLSDSRFVEGVTRAQIAKFRLEPGDLLMTRYNGSRHLVGIAGMVPAHSEPVLHPDKLIRLQADRALIDPRFLALQLQGRAVRAFLEPRIRTSAGQSGIAGEDVRSIPLVVPDLGEQRRIVEILEDHLSRLDAARLEMARSRRRLDALWSATLSGARLGGEVALAQIADIQGGVQKQPRRAPVEHHYPFLRVANVTSSGLDLSDVHRVELFGEELERLRLQRGDLLVVEGNGSQSQIGRAAAWDGSIDDCVHQNHLIRVRPRSGIHPDYLEAVWNSPEHRQALMRVASSSSGLHTLSVAKLKRLSIPVPDVADQQRVVARVREVRDFISHLALAIQMSNQREVSLRRAVLAAAFEGRLTGRRSDDDVIEELADV